MHFQRKRWWGPIKLYCSFREYVFADDGSRRRNWSGLKMYEDVIRKVQGNIAHKNRLCRVSKDEQREEGEERCHVDLAVLK